MTALELYEDLQALAAAAEAHHVGPCYDRVLEAMRSTVRGSAQGIGVMSEVLRRIDRVPGDPS